MSSKTMIKELSLDFCHVTIYKDYMVTVMNEGITVIPKYNDILIDIANSYFKDTSFVYITHRKHSYSVNPTIYLETSKIENLKGFAVVKTDKQQEIDVADKNIVVEKLFFQKPFNVFTTLPEAIEWKTELIKAL